jgi:hypothetical protein
MSLRLYYNYHTSNKKLNFKVFKEFLNYCCTYNLDSSTFDKTSTTPTYTMSIRLLTHSDEIARVALVAGYDQNMKRSAQGLPLWSVELVGRLTEFESIEIQFSADGMNTVHMVQSGKCYIIALVTFGQTISGWVFQSIIKSKWMGFVQYGIDFQSHAKCFESFHELVDLIFIKGM